MTHIELKKRIMMRVYMIYTLKRLREPFAAEILLLIVSSVLLFVFVSVPHVIGNIAGIPHNFSSLYNFILAAILGTGLMVQTILLSLAVAGTMLVRNFVSLYTIPPKGNSG